MGTIEVLTSSNKLRDDIEKLSPELSVEGGAGDTRIQWDPHDEDKVKAAKAAFDLLKSKGFTFFRVEGGERAGERVESFDETVGDLEMKLTAVPRMAGG